MNQLVSVIITTHNRPELLKKAIESVLSQTYDNIELIVVDDASDIEKNEFCKNLRLKYIYISKEESRGGNYARNKGIKNSKGQYIAFLDDDDTWASNKIEKQISCAKENDAQVVHCSRNMIFLNKDGSSHTSIHKVDVLLLGVDIKQKVFTTIPTTTSCLMVSRNAIESVGFFDENLKFWQEYEFCIRLAQKYTFYAVCDPLTNYLVNVNDKGRLTNKYSLWKESVKYIQNKHRELYDDLSLFDSIRYKLLVLNDSANRLKSCGLLLKGMIQYGVWFVFSFPFRCVDKIKRNYVTK